MTSALLISALFMGLVGGPHCIAMCNTACVGAVQACGARAQRSLWLFQAGRLMAYSALGALAAGSTQALGWLTTQSLAWRPLWSLFHLGLLAVGVWLLVQATQPRWMATLGQQLWLRVRAWASQRGVAAPLSLGAMWAFMPCGLLYAALMLAALAHEPVQGAAAMAAFALGSGVSLLAAPWLLVRGVRLLKLEAGAWPVRMAGAALAASSAWALWLSWFHNAAPWCVAP
jgi:sulfite exporter TauE/SafE